jgi:hypothetical protein
MPFVILICKKWYNFLFYSIQDVGVWSPGWGGAESPGRSKSSTLLWNCMSGPWGIQGGLLCAHSSLPAPEVSISTDLVLQGQPWFKNTKQKISEINNS